MNHKEMHEPSKLVHVSPRSTFQAATPAAKRLVSISVGISASISVSVSISIIITIISTSIIILSIISYYH